MSKPINKHPYRLGNEHGEIRFGHIINPKQFGYYVRTGDDGGRHYIRMRTNGDVAQGHKGSTDINAPGQISINCGSDIVTSKTDDVESAPRGFNLLANNGDIVIRAANGNIKLIAKNIDIIAEGSGKQGNLLLEGNKYINIKAPKVDCSSTICTNLVSNNQVSILGERVLQTYGGFYECADSNTLRLGSKNSDKESAKEGKISSVFEQAVRVMSEDIPFADIASKLEKEKAGAVEVIDRQKDIATSDEVADLTEQLGTVGEKLTGKTSQLKGELSRLSKGFGDALNNL